MDSFVSFRIYDIHYKVELIEGEEYLSTIDPDEPYKLVTHPYSFDVLEKRIKEFREWMLFDNQDFNSPKRCTLVSFNDGSSVYCTNVFETFQKTIIPEYLQKLDDCSPKQYVIVGGESSSQ